MKDPSQLSRGTREQLYLAIRLAYVKRYCEDAEPLPLVMDDVLVNFDDGRARRAVEVLAELSETVQILFLTCHENRIALFREVLPDAEPVVLPGGEKVEMATPKGRPPWDEAGNDTTELWAPLRDIFERDGHTETRSRSGTRRGARSGAESEVPGRESSLRRRPGPLEE